MKYITEQGWEIYLHQMTEGGVPTDKLSFMGGIGVAIGILKGTLDVGLPEHVRSSQVLQQMVDELSHFTERELEPLVGAAREKDRLFKQLLGMENLESERRN